MMKKPIIYPHTLTRAQTQTGFTLIEVLIAILVAAVGLLGLSKIQSLASSSSSTSRVRSLVALQASSLASVMRGNRGFWTSDDVLPGFTVKNTTVQYGSTTCSGISVNSPFSSISCGGVSNLAFADLQIWANSLAGLQPSATTTISCTPEIKTPAASPVAGVCKVTIQWSEKYTGNGQIIAENTAHPNPDSAATGGVRSYTQYIEP